MNNQATAINEMFTAQLQLAEDAARAAQAAVSALRVAYIKHLLRAAFPDLHRVIFVRVWEGQSPEVGGLERVDGPPAPLDVDPDERTHLEPHEAACVLEVERVVQGLSDDDLGWICADALTPAGELYDGFETFILQFGDASSEAPGGESGVEPRCITLF